jgi:hypothetical protein
LQCPVSRSVCELEQLAAERRGPVELAAVEVEAREAPDDRGALRGVSRLAGESERPFVVLLGLLRVAADGEQAAGEARVKRDLLAPALRRRRNGREHAEEIVRELDRSVVPTARVVERPESLEQRIEAFGVGRLDPVAPRREQVAELGPQLVECRVPTGPVEPSLPVVRELGEVLGVRMSRC